MYVCQITLETEGLWLRKVFRGLDPGALLLRRLSGAIQDTLTFPPGEFISVPNHLCIIRSGVVCTVLGGKRTLIKLRGKPFAFEQILENDAMKTSIFHYSLSQVTVATMHRDVFYKVLPDFPEAYSKFKQKILGMSLVYFSALCRLYAPFIIYDDKGVPCDLSDSREKFLPLHVYALTLDSQIKRQLLELLALSPLQRRAAKHGNKSRTRRSAEGERHETNDEKGKGKAAKGSESERNLVSSRTGYSRGRKEARGRAERDTIVKSQGGSAELARQPKKTTVEPQGEQSGSNPRKRRKEPGDDAAMIQLAESPVVLHQVSSIGHSIGKHGHDNHHN